MTRRNKEVQEVEEDEEEDEKAGKSPAQGGFVLEFDAARKIAQGLGANLEELRSVVEVKGQTARLLPVGERAVYLLGKPSLGIAPRPSEGSRKARTGFLPGMEDVKKGKSRASDESGDGDEIGAFEYRNHDPRPDPPVHAPLRPRSVRCLEAVPGR